MENWTLKFLRGQILQTNNIWIETWISSEHLDLPHHNKQIKQILDCIASYFSKISFHHVFRE